MTADVIEANAYAAFRQGKFRESAALFLQAAEQAPSPVVAQMLLFFAADAHQASRRAARQPISE